MASKYQKYQNQTRTHLNKAINMKHECLSPDHDELVDTSDGMRAYFGVGVFEELQEFGYHEVERRVE